MRLSTCHAPLKLLGPFLKDEMALERASGPCHTPWCDCNSIYGRRTVHCNRILVAYGSNLGVYLVLRVRCQGRGKAHGISTTQDSFSMVGCIRIRLFLQIRGVFCRCCCNSKNQTILGSIFGALICANSHIQMVRYSMACCNSTVHTMGLRSLL